MGVLGRRSGKNTGHTQRCNPWDCFNSTDGSLFVPDVEFDFLSPTKKSFDCCLYNSDVVALVPSAL